MIQANVIDESVQKYLFFIFNFNFGKTLFAKRASITAAHSSRRGRDIIFNGAIFDFAQISLVTCTFLLLEQRMYKHAPYANKLASAKPCICIS